MIQLTYDLPIVTHSGISTGGDGDIANCELIHLGDFEPDAEWVKMETWIVGQIGVRMTTIMDKVAELLAVTEHQLCA
jgi:hypothetical protein